MTSSELNERFPCPSVTFRDASGGYVFIDIENEQGRAEISLYGGHVLTFESTGGIPVLWMSDDAILERGTAIRGGIPIYWPWFGKHPELDDAPSHGFARLFDWSVESVDSLDEGTQVVLTLTDSEATLALWPHSFKLTLSITVSTELTVQLTTENTSDDSFTLTQALHSYFTVGDIHETSVSGLEGTRYLDAANGLVETVDDGPITFDAETDRDYLETTADCVIHDAALGREIHIAKTGSNSTVIWNPWTEKSKTMADFPDDAFPGMVCVETTNATAFDTVVVEPGSSHILSTRISVQ
jgi:glucose-6-phosphate 1-epimerase